MEKLQNHLTENEAKKNSYTEILLEIYDYHDLKKVIYYCITHGYRLAYCMHYKEVHAKPHYHAFIKSDSKHRFNVSSLISETLQPYNFEKTKSNTMLKFANYVMHNDYDFKEKYAFEEIFFVNVSDHTLKEIDYSLRNVINEIDEKDIYNSEQLERLMFKGYFKRFNEVIEYCSRNVDLRRYFTFHSRQIYNAFQMLTCGNFHNMEDLQECLYE